MPILSDDDVRTDFGTGLMMVCTFGDGADVQRWKRDGLDLRMGIDAAGKLTDVAGAYAGMDIERARKQIATDLEAAGALRGAQKIEQQVSVAERTQRPVEFQMRPHWFVRVLDLEGELLARSDELAWYPEYMKVRLDRWIEGLKYDWNITRQRFYGVPFPVWYCSECDEAVLATEDQLPVDPLESPPPVESCAKCGGREFAGDPDVMDTWMTSSLTPQFNANWARSPDRVAAAPLPMTLRVQAFEIIRTWLFYTLVKGHAHNDMIPWENVMISGWGLNENGKKFSKRDLTAGKEGEFNKYDPEDVIDKYGADSLRFWAAGSHLGHDLRYHEADVKAGRKLVLKLWNIARLVEQYAPGYTPDDAVALDERTAEDRWIVGRLHRLLPVVERGFDTYDFAIAREALDQFFWTEFCDDYVELVKDRFWTEASYTDEQRASARTTLSETLRTLLALYAPFLPFVTEELYQYMYAAHEGAVSLHVTSWPEAPASPLAEVAEIDLVRGVLRAVRAERTRTGLPQGRPLQELVVDVDEVATRAHARVDDPEPLRRRTCARHPFRHRCHRHLRPRRPHRHRPRTQADLTRTTTTPPSDGGLSVRDGVHILHHVMAELWSGLEWSGGGDGVADGDAAGGGDERADAEVAGTFTDDRAEHVEIAFDASGLRTGDHHAAVDLLAHGEHGAADSHGSSDECFLVRARQNDVGTEPTRIPRAHRRFGDQRDARAGGVVERARRTIPGVPIGGVLVFDVERDLVAAGPIGVGPL